MMGPLGHGDEAMLRDPNHPAHTSGGREGGMSAILVIVLGIIFFNVYEITWLSVFWKCFLLLLVSVSVGFFMAIQIGGSKERAKRREQQKYREMMEAEKKKQIEQMRLRKSNNADTKRDSH